MLSAICGTLRVEFAYLTCLLILDRICIGREKRELVALVVQSIVRHKDDSIDRIGRAIRPYSLTDSRIAELLAGKIKQENGKASLIDGSEWHGLLPWLPREQKGINGLVKYLRIDRLMPFPEFRELNMGDVSLREAFSSKFLFAVIYDILYHHMTHPSTAVHFGLNLFILCVKTEEGATWRDSPPLIAANSIAQLADAIEGSFQEFIRTPVYYKLGCPNTLIKILLRIGDIAVDVLHFLGIKAAVQGKEEEEVDVKELKKKVVEDFEERKQQFEEKAMKDVASGNCAICGLPEGGLPMLYPCVCFSNGIQVYVDRLQNRKKTGLTRVPTPEVMGQLYCCTHLVHAKCVTDTTRYQCPKCTNGAYRNCFLPRLSENMKETEDDRVSAIIDDLPNLITNESDSTSLVRSLASQIGVLEIRARSLPEILYREEEAALLRHLWLCVLYIYRKRKDKENPDVMKCFDATIWHCMTNYLNVKNKITCFLDLIEFVNRLNCEPKDVQMPVYLRRVVLFGYFMLGFSPTPNEALVDWDDLLSNARLCKLFRRKNEQWIIPRFGPIPLADEWVELMHAPYSMDILDMSYPRYICLVQGALVKIHHRHGGNRDERDLVDLVTYAEYSWKRTPTLLMSFSGGDATSVRMASLQFNQYVYPDVFYVDKFGSPDIGFDRGQYLTLDREKLTVVFDDFLSGRMHDKLRE
jgi:hypothetical protein